MYLLFCVFGHICEDVYKSKQPSSKRKDVLCRIRKDANIIIQIHDKYIYVHYAYILHKKLDQSKTVNIFTVQYYLKSKITENSKEILSNFLPHFSDYCILYFAYMNTYHEHFYDSKVLTYIFNFSIFPFII